MYVCGITPYDATHLGHAATYLAFDSLHRVWLDAGVPVRYVQNVTDVDDPLLERARRDDEDWRALAQRQTDLFREDMTALRVLPPTAYVTATEALPLIVGAVEALQARGAAYAVDGDLYFPVSASPRFGSVAGLDREQMLDLFAERGGDPGRSGKKDPLDCLLWQAARPEEPSWSSPLGAGRPGWHVECAAIAVHHLGPRIDVQGGGSDLAFPHHEMGAAEAEVLTGQSPFAGHYVHAGMVGLDGEKMSKSRGNLVFVSALRRGEGGVPAVDPMALRLALLAHHYRADWEWTDGELVRAQDRLARWQAAAGPTEGTDGGDADGTDGAAGLDDIAGLALLHEMRAALADDLGTPAAVAAVDRWAAATTANSAATTGRPPAGSPLVRRAVDALLGVRL